MKNIFSGRRNKSPHTNEEAEKEATPFFAKENKKPFFNTSKGAIQPKLAVGQPGDKYEKEADSMADAVVNNSAKPDIQNKEISDIQRESLATPQEDEKLGTAEQRVEEDKLVQEKPEVQKMEGKEEEEPVQMMSEEEEEPVQMMSEEEEEPVQMMGEEEEEPVQMMSEEEEEPVQMMEGEEEEEVQAKHNSNTARQTANTGLSNAIKEKSGKGKQLPKNVKEEMETSFGTDFTDVNIHTDQEAARMNKELGAQAFTHGNDVYFNSGKYNPESNKGKHLLAHELTHVVQQGGKKKSKKKQK
ncbi:DUF4157 domain-containing protein [Aquimarina aggregata]|uniref:eCIS core domain-containing protein n=1 Tax=Aquimarina aggregata TaxID=1642818 RepID=UPI0024905105|nr:DUF4157 domain-containing protein [Aquimarina aggregata]